MTENIDFSQSNPGASDNLFKKLFYFSAPFLFCTITIVLSKSGFSDEDDRYYLIAIDGWESHFPFLGTLHWHFRYALVLAAAASVGLFGRTELAIMFPAVLSLYGTAGLTYIFLRRFCERRQACIGAIVTLSAPVLVVYAKIPYPEELELFLSVASFWLFWTAAADDRPGRLMFAGLLLGLQWITRVTVAPLALLYGLLSLVGWRVGYRGYARLWSGFLVPVVFEFVATWAATGNPFYRFEIDAHSLEIPSTHMIGGIAGGLRPPFNWHLMAKWLPNSFIDVHWLVNPYIDLLTHPLHGFLCLVAVFSIRPLLRRWPRTSEAGAFVRALAFWAFLTIFVSLYVLNLRPQPRYFATLTWMCGILAALWLFGEGAKHRRDIVLLGCSTIVVLNLLSINLRADPLYAERQLAAFAAQAPEPLWAEAATVEHGQFFLTERGLSSRVHAASPTAVAPGGLFFVSAGDISRDDLASWPIVARIEPPVAFLAAPFAPFLSGKLDSIAHRNYPELLVLRKPGSGADTIEKMPAPEQG